ncbi:MAG: hypothetical protein L0191_20805 [Acidobacteria bacterium]|nr:hypothetical protein [Acidobacteriota bacterium]
MRYARRVVLLLPLGLLVGCSIDPSSEALKSLGETSFSPKYHSGFWASEAEKKSPLWEKARAQCSTPDKGTTPNCRVVIAVDLTVRVVPIRQGDDVNERVKEWVRRGTAEVPPYVPGKGFGPEPPKMPKPPGR